MILLRLTPRRGCRCSPACRCWPCATALLEWARATELSCRPRRGARRARPAAGVPRRSCASPAASKRQARPRRVPRAGAEYNEGGKGVDRLQRLWHGARRHARAAGQARRARSWTGCAAATSTGSSAASTRAAARRSTSAQQADAAVDVLRRALPGDVQGRRRLASRRAGEQLSDWVRKASGADTHEDDAPPSRLRRADERASDEKRGRGARRRGAGRGRDDRRARHRVDGRALRRRAGRARPARPALRRDVARDRGRRRASSASPSRTSTRSSGSTSPSTAPTRSRPTAGSSRAAAARTRARRSSPRRPTGSSSSPTRRRSSTRCAPPIPLEILAYGADGDARARCATSTPRDAPPSARRRPHRRLPRRRSTTRPRSPPACRRRPASSTTASSRLRSRSSRCRLERRYAGGDCTRFVEVGAIGEDRVASVPHRERRPSSARDVPRCGAARRCAGCRGALRDRVGYTRSSKRDALDVVRLREHVDRPHALERVAGLGELRRVRRERRRVARDVDDALRRGLDDAAHDLLREARRAAGRRRRRRACRPSRRARAAPGGRRRRRTARCSTSLRLGVGDRVADRLPRRPRAPHTSPARGASVRPIVPMPQYRS